MWFRLFLLLLSSTLVHCVNTSFCFACDTRYSYPESKAHDVCTSKHLKSQLINISCNPIDPSEASKGVKSVCFMTKRISKKYENESYIYERGCTTIGGTTDYCLERQTHNPEIECDLCEGNNCNDADDMHVVRFMMFLLAVFLVLYMRDQAERNQLRDSRPIKW